MIEIDELQVDLGGRTVLREVSLTVGNGELVYLLGRNGAGKSTLLRTMCGMITPRAGRVRIDGIPVRALSSPAQRLGMHLGIEPVHRGHTARRHLRWLAAAAGIDKARVDVVLAQTGVADYGRRRIGDYSLGMRQRLGIAAALLPDAPVVLLDEPLNGLDIEGIIWLRRILTGLAAEGRSVIVASHLLDEVRRSADRIAIIDRRTVTRTAGIDEFLDGHVDLEAAYLAEIGDPAGSAS